MVTSPGVHVLLCRSMPGRNLAGIYTVTLIYLPLHWACACAINCKLTSNWCTNLQFVCSQVQGVSPQVGACLCNGQKVAMLSSHTILQPPSISNPILGPQPLPWYQEKKDFSVAFSALRLSPVRNLLLVWWWLVVLALGFPGVQQHRGHWLSVISAAEVRSWKSWEALLCQTLGMPWLCAEFLGHKEPQQAAGLLQSGDRCTVGGLIL